MVEVSVIVPIYNVRDYLAQAVASIREQTFADFECILVDDGSTDGSGELCDQLVKEDARFRVVHKINGGLSDARNAGLDEASGRYVAFVDSDDRLLPSALEDLRTKLLEASADVAVGGVVLHDVRTGEERPFAPLTTPRPKNVLEELFNIAAWNKLYRREIFATRRFRKGIKFEDVPMWAEILFSGAKIVYADKFVYIYNINREGSIVSTRDYRGYPAAWESQREALRSAGYYDRDTANAFVCRVALKFLQAFNLSGAKTRHEFYKLTRNFFNGCGSFGPGHERGSLVSWIAYLHALACRRLPYRLYRLVFGFEAIIASPRLNAFLKRTLQK